jgi:hypothetical protein
VTVKLTKRAKISIGAFLTLIAACAWFTRFESIADVSRSDTPPEMRR